MLINNASGLPATTSKLDVNEEDLRHDGHQRVRRFRRYSGVLRVGAVFLVGLVLNLRPRPLDGDSTKVMANKTVRRAELE